MLTPQDLQEVSFEKAKIGGYVMKSVDEFLEPLIEDYVTIYKENAVLKSKMRLLVERLEEYRASEADMRASAEQAQASAARIVEEARRQSEEILARARAEAETKSQDADSAVATETERLRVAKEATAEFVTAVEAQIARHQQALEMLKGLGLPKAAPKTEDVRVYGSEPVAPAASAEAIAAQIEENVGRITGGYPAPDPKAATRVMPTLDERTTAKFANLKFGKNYQP